MSSTTTIPSFHLSDGTQIPWLAWGNGSGKANKSALTSGAQALNAGIRHIDTAQLYGTEEATGQVVAESEVSKEDVYVTDKISCLPGDKPMPLDQARDSILESIKKLGFTPDLFLIHNPYVAPAGELKALWTILEELKTEGKLKSIGVSNFRVQDLEAVLDGAKYKPVINQIEYHPYTLSHLEPVLALQAKHGILSASYGPLTPVLRHPTGGPLKPILERIAQRLTVSTGDEIDATVVLLLWTRAVNVVAVTTSGTKERIEALAKVSRLPDLLEPEEVEEITRVGKAIHFRHYTEHMENDFPLPDLPRGY